jgi:hypothetical protein
MKKIILLLVALVTDTAIAETVTLTLPGNASLSFDTPQMTKLKEVSKGGSYQYFASSIGSPDPRFNLSVYAEPISCHFGASLKEVTHCFLERSDLIPGIREETRSTRCDEQRCEVIYVTAAETEKSVVVQMHTNTILVYGKLWVDIHFSVTGLKRETQEEDKRTFAKLAGSLSFVEHPK